MESMRTEKPIVFLMHPNECLEAKDGIKPTRRAKNAIEHLFADVLRHGLKNRNMGTRAVGLIDATIRRAKDSGFEFVTAKEYRLKHGNHLE